MATNIESQTKALNDHLAISGDRRLLNDARAIVWTGEAIARAIALAGTQIAAALNSANR